MNTFPTQSILQVKCLALAKIKLVSGNLFIEGGP